MAEDIGEGGGPRAPFFVIPEGLREWLLAFDFQILTWHLDIGTYILGAIEWILTPLNAIAEWIAQLVAWWEEFRQEVLDFFNNVGLLFGEVWNWITNFWSTLLDWVNNWWQAIYSTVKEWVEARIDTIREIVSDITKQVSRIAIMVEDFFTSTLPSLARSVDVFAWITEALLPFRAMFNFFEAFKGELIAFFSDPLQWVYDKLDEFFDRFW